MIYYNQRNYGSMAYPAPGYESATVKTSGCGPVCMSMVIENLGAGSFPPEKSVALALSSGARVSGGTDMEKLAKAVCEKFPVKYSTTTSGDAAFSKMRYTRGAHGSKAIVICNVKGDVGSYKGLFSDSGHYVVAAGIGEVYVTVLDPYLYPGKFDTASRRGRAVVNGNLVYCTPANLAMDTKKYYIFERVKKTMTVNEAIKALQDKGVIQSPAYWQNAVQVVKYLDELLINMAGALQ